MQEILRRRISIGMVIRGCTPRMVGGCHYKPCAISSPEMHSEPNLDVSGLNTSNIIFRMVFIVRVIYKRKSATSSPSQVWSQRNLSPTIMHLRTLFGRALALSLFLLQVSAGICISNKKLNETLIQLLVDVAPGEAADAANTATSKVEEPIFKATAAFAGDNPFSSTSPAVPRGVGRLTNDARCCQRPTKCN